MKKVDTRNWPMGLSDEVDRFKYLENETRRTQTWVMAVGVLAVCAVCFVVIIYAGMR